MLIIRLSPIMINAITRGKKPSSGPNLLQIESFVDRKAIRIPNTNKNVLLKKSFLFLMNMFHLE
jgi:hypothetical protein